ncbi:hypothetical protein [Dyadobacter sp. CY356]|uniref:hypothetical protein n=1 Tax=Dyadobacter sp. CY356 TaxID=2906442 RepID=UPI001F293AAF|nr:hypothetical protein [Dyadobacter sp. CY356]MCF0054260.1 hypothetical protein [Dyadobacter sp. CY356]
MKSIIQRSSMDFTFIVILMFIGITCSSDRSIKESITEASSAYGILAEKSLDLMAEFDFETWGTMLSDSVVYYFPNGDEASGQKLIGKTALLAWWKNYITVSGIRSMSIENASYVPICIEKNARSGVLPGNQVIACFLNKMIYENGVVSVKMNFIIHFDKNKMIDGYYTYYDMTAINKIQKV